MTLYTFPELGLGPDADDATVWRVCQANGILLFTGNRNKDGAESLEATIRANTTDQRLPVLTVPDADRILRDKAYAERVAIRLLEILDDLPLLRGAARLYLP